MRLVTVSGRGTVTRAASAALELAAEADRGDAQAMGKAVAQALGRLRLKPGAVVMGVPRASVLLRTLYLPEISVVEEVASMVHLQIAKDLPFRIQEAVVDFKVHAAVPAKAPGAAGGGRAALTEEGAAGSQAAAPKMEVLVAVVKREVVDFYVKMATAAGVKLVSLGLFPYANVRCLEACHAAEAGAGVAIITLRPDEVGIDLVAREALLFSRGASLRRSGDSAGGPPGTAGLPSMESTRLLDESRPGSAGAGSEGTGTGGVGGYVEAVTIEVVRSLHSYGGLDAPSPVSKMVVTGATGQEAAVAAALQARLGVACRVLEVGESISMSSGAGEPTACTMSAVGLALGANDEAGLPFDFLNPKRPAPPRDLRKLRLLLGAVALLAVLLFVFGLRSYLVNERVRLKMRLGQELIDARKKRPLYGRMRQQLSTIRDWTQGAHNWLEHYAYLSAVLPSSEEVYVTSLSISGSGAIRLSVQARSGQILAKLDKQLRAAGYEVKPLAITPGEDKHGYGFRSTVELEVPARMKFDLGKVKPPGRPADDASLDGRKGAGP
jgi:Tfp pilus assembly PilM family ATPase